MPTEAPEVLEKFMYEGINKIVLIAEENSAQFSQR